MMTQTKQTLESCLINTLQKMGYKYISIRERDNLLNNFKIQLEKHNQKVLALHSRKHFTNEEFEKIRIHLEGGTRFEKAKKLRDLFPLELENGEHIGVEFLNKNKWCENEFQVSNQIDGVDKVMFVVDKYDLNKQTQSEYKISESGTVDGTENTRQLIKRLSSNSKIIVTTIQKLNSAVTKDYYNKHMQKIG